MKYRFSLQGRSSGNILVSLIDYGAVDVNGVFEPQNCDDRAIVTFIPPCGYWTEVRQVDINGADEEVVFRELPKSGPKGWWHEIHGATNHAKRGAGIRIGVIDEALPPHGPESTIAHVNDLRDEGWQIRDAMHRASTPLTDHSVSVCSLLAARTTRSECYEGVAPKAEVYFAAAGNDSAETLDASRIVGSLDLLSGRYGCHLVSISAGGPDFDLPGLHSAIRRAQKRGTLCVFAAGNSGACEYPAKYPESVAVAAMGHYGTGPLGTDVWARAEFESARTSDPALFLWTESAVGTDVDIAAIGIGPIWNDGAAPGRAACGTSFACPIAVGCLAVLLGDDPQYLGLPADINRTRHAEQLLSRSRALTVNGVEFTKHGLIVTN